MKVWVYVDQAVIQREMTTLAKKGLAENTIYVMFDLSDSSGIKLKNSIELQMEYEIFSSLLNNSITCL